MSAKTIFSKQLNAYAQKREKIFLTKNCSTKSYIKTLFLPFIIVSHLNGQINQSVNKKTDSTTTWNNFEYDIVNVFKGMGYTYTSPLRWEKRDLTRFGAVVGGTLITSFADRAAKDFFENQSDRVPQVIHDYGWYYGSPQNNYMLTGVVYLTGLFTKNQKLRRTGVLLISSASAAGLFQQASKHAFGRARPRSGFEYNHFRPFSRDKDFHSFPSGHAILAFTNAYAIGKQFKSPWVKAGIYTVGIIPGVSRLWEGAHWLSDVIFSVAVSIFTVEAVDKYLDGKYSKKYNHGDRIKELRWSLKFAPNQLGVVVNF